MSRVGQSLGLHSDRLTRPLPHPAHPCLLPVPGRYLVGTSFAVILPEQGPIAPHDR